LILAASLALAVASGCSRDPQAQARKYVASGDAYLAKHLLNSR
jgi:hypothetical protein